jgi:hypothetical protein
MGLVGDERATVIARGGWLARIQDTLADASRSFLIDASVFPGNSGGAVILKPETAAIQGTPAISRALLLGIVAAYVPYRDYAISMQTQRPRVIFEENSGLVTVYPVDCIEQTIATIPMEDGAEPERAALKKIPDEEVSESLDVDDAAGD